MQDVEQLVGVMALFSGGGVWGTDAMVLVFEEVKRVEWGFDPCLGV